VDTRYSKRERRTRLIASAHRLAASARHAAAGGAGYALALVALVALRCDSFTYVAARAMHSGSRSRRGPVSSVRHPSTTASRRTDVVAIQGGPQATRLARTDAIGHLESEGSLVAATLAVVAVGYGGLLVMSWRDPAPRVAMSPITIRPLVTGGVGVAPLPVEARLAPAPLSSPTAALPRAQVIDTSTLGAIWRRGDTRSLDHAFDSLRRQTLAFHRCGVQVTAVDRAVARCDGLANRSMGDGDAARHVTWTIDFRRTGDRWSIQRVSNR
jgi:hypothetical protein